MCLRPNACRLCGRQGSVAGAVVGHHSLHLDAEARIVGERRFQEGGRALLFFSFCITCVKSDARMHHRCRRAQTPSPPLPGASVALHLYVAGDAMAHAIDLAELLDVDVDHLARVLALIATHRLAAPRAHLVQAQAACRYGSPSPARYHFAAICSPVQPLPPQRLDPFDHIRSASADTTVWPRAAILQPCQPSCDIAQPTCAPSAGRHLPLPHCLRRLPAHTCPHPLSTTRR